MSSSPRRKACRTCAVSKRSCDKNLPACQRCILKGVECVYPRYKKHRRQELLNEPPVVTQSMLGEAAQEAVFGLPSNLDGDWDVAGMLGAETLDFGLDVSYDIPSATTSIDPDYNEELQIEAVSLRPWYLEQETWVMRRRDRHVNESIRMDFHAIIEWVRAMLESWIKQGHNSILHRGLYDSVMPGCLQDAYTTLAAYLSTTPVMKSTVLQIANDRAADLVAKEWTVSSRVEDLMEHFGRVYALSVYQFIRLFDGSMYNRTAAERQIVVLRRWTLQLWEAARGYDGDDPTSIAAEGPTPWNDFELELQHATTLWRQWILIESIRRTLIIIDITTKIYETMSKEAAECTGVVMFTGNKGLWDARSPIGWLRETQRQVPTMVTLSQPSLYRMLFVAGGLDEFTRTLLGHMAGEEMVQSWIDQAIARITV